jgi:hypothetical protein
MLRLVVFLLFLAAVLYALFWLLDQRATKSGGSPRRRGGEPGGRSAPRGPVGPDDDDDFLRELDWKARDRKRHEHEGDG